jgi:hypothetical protein
MPVLPPSGRPTHRRYAGARALTTIAGGVVLLQLGGCVDTILPAALSVAEQVLLVRFLPLLPLF